MAGFTGGWFVGFAFCGTTGALVRSTGRPAVAGSTPKPISCSLSSPPLPSPSSPSTSKSGVPELEVRAPAGFPRVRASAAPVAGGDHWKRSFLANYWQKKPLLIRSAFDPDDISSLLSPDELAGLACEQHVESRIISQPTSPVDWQLALGPFEEEHFSTLPETNYTLLVQEVNRHVPEALALLDHFSFLPNHRMDDLMVSYAAPGGGVGPHLDNYDVFLLQANGTRRWRIGAAPLSRRDARDAPHVPDVSVRVLSEMEVACDWTLHPGDMLYVPPRLPHWGVAEQDDGCMTFSVGFRAPTTAELVTRLADRVSDNPDCMDDFLEDNHADLIRNMHQPGKISEDVMAQAKARVQEALFGDGKFEAWFSQALSEPKRYRPEEPEVSDEQTDQEIDQALSVFFDEIGSSGALSLAEGPLYRQGGVTFCYREDRPTVLFVDGMTYSLDACAVDAIALLCGHSRFDLSDGSKHREILSEGLSPGSPFRSTFVELFKKGLIYFEEPAADPMEEEN